MISPLNHLNANPIADDFIGQLNLAVTGQKEFKILKKGQGLGEWFWKCCMGQVSFWLHFFLANLYKIKGLVFRDFSLGQYWQYMGNYWDFPDVRQAITCLSRTINQWCMADVEPLQLKNEGWGKPPCLNEFMLPRKLGKSSWCS